MIIVLSILYILGRFANTISLILFLFYDLKSEKNRFFILVCNLVEFSTYGMNLFVFYSFDKNFARILNKYLLDSVRIVLRCERNKKNDLF